MICPRLDLDEVPESGAGDADKKKRRMGKRALWDLSQHCPLDLCGTTSLSTKMRRRLVHLSHCGGGLCQT